MDGAERVPRPRYTAKRKEFFLPKRGGRLAEKRRTGYFSSLIDTLGYNPALCKHKIYFHTNLTRTSYSAVRYQGGALSSILSKLSPLKSPHATPALRKSHEKRGRAPVTESFSRKKACVFLEFLDAEKKSGLEWDKIAHLRSNFAIVTDFSSY